MANEIPVFVMKENWYDKDGVEWTDICHKHVNFITVRKDVGGYEPAKRPFEVVVYSKANKAKIINRVETARYITLPNAMAGAKTKSKFWGAHYDQRKTETKKERTR